VPLSRRNRYCRARSALVESLSSGSSTLEACINAICRFWSRSPASAMAVKFDCASAFARFDWLKMSAAALSANKPPRANYPMSESEASAQITGISGGFIGTLRLSERTGKYRMVCTITMAGVEELESRELL
jgi:hypothetical protein